MYFSGKMLMHQHFPVGKPSSMYLLMYKYNQRGRGQRVRITWGKKKKAFQIIQVKSGDDME